MNKKNKNVLFITLYRIFSRMYFYLPIIFPLLYYHGQNELEIEILLAVYGVSIVLLSGIVKYVTFKIGHKNALIFGELSKIAGLVLLMFYANNFEMSVIAQLVMGMGYTFIVGNDTVILQQTFSSENSVEYHRIQSITNGYMFISLLFSGVIGIIIYKYSPQIVLLISVMAALFSIISILFVSYQKVSILSIHKSNILLLNNSANNYYYLIRGMIFPIFVGLYPYLFFMLMKLNIIWFAMIIGAFSIAGYLSSKHLTNILKNLQFKMLTLGSYLIIIAALILLLFGNVYLCVLSSCLLGLASGCIRPLTIIKTDNKKYDIEKTLKVSEFNYGIMNAFILLSAGILLDYVRFNVFVLIFILLSAIYVVAKIYQQSEGDIQ